MKRFGFRLQKVLNYREGIEEQRQAMLARAIEAVQAQQQEVEQLDRLAAEAMAEVRRLGNKKVDIQALMQGQAHLGAIRRRVGIAVEHLRAMELRFEEARQGFVNARKDRRALELLRGQRATEYERETGLQEQKELDEIGSRPWQLERKAE